MSCTIQAVCFTRLCALSYAMWWFRRFASQDFVPDPMPCDEAVKQSGTYPDSICFILAWDRVGWRHTDAWRYSRLTSFDTSLVDILVVLKCIVCFVLFEFRSFRSIRTIVGLGGVIGPLPRPKRANYPEKSSQRGRLSILVFQRHDLCEENFYAFIWWCLIINN